MFKSIKSNKVQLGQRPGDLEGAYKELEQALCRAGLIGELWGFEVGAIQQYKAQVPKVRGSDSKTLPGTA